MCVFFWNCFKCYFVGTTYLLNYIYVPVDKVIHSNTFAKTRKKIIITFLPLARDYLCSILSSSLFSFRCIIYFFIHRTYKYVWVITYQSWAYWYIYFNPLRLLNIILIWWIKMATFSFPLLQLGDTICFLFPWIEDWPWALFWPIKCNSSDTV